METRRSQFALKLLPSFTDFAFLMPIAFLFGRMEGANTLLADCDTGWHIRTGEWILAHRGVPAHDMFSYSMAGAPWFAWEWLSDIILAGLNNAGGLRAVVFASMVLIAIIYTMMYRMVRAKSNPVIAIVVTILASAASSIHWLARPHLFTLFFLVLFYGALERVREGRDRIVGIPILALLPVITILWTNLHGGFFVGVMMIGAFGMGELLKTLSAGDGQPRDWRPAGRYFSSAAAAMAASLINPYTYHLHVHMASYLRNPFNSQHIVEFFSPSFHHPAAIFFEAMLVLGVAAAYWSLSRRQLAEPLILLAWAHAALLAARNIPIFMIAAAPVVGAALQDWLTRLPSLQVSEWLRAAVRKFNHVAAETAETETIGRWHLVSGIAVALVMAVLWAPNPPKKFRSEFDPERYPAKALAMLRADTSARIFSNDEWGDYLIWSLYPHHKVFVDGRTDFYGNDFEEQYLDVMKVKYGWEKTLGSFAVDTILLPPSEPLVGALKESSRWRVVYDDGVALVFRSTESTRSSELQARTSGVRSSQKREYSNE